MEQHRRTTLTQQPVELKDLADMAKRVLPRIVRNTTAFATRTITKPSEIQFEYRKN